MCVAVHYASGGPDAGDVLQEPHAGGVHQGSALSQSAAADGHVGVSRGCPTRSVLLVTWWALSSLISPPPQ